MTEWINVIASNGLADGEHLVFDLDGIDVAVFKVNGEFFAIEDACSHDGAEIASGILDGHTIMCPRHGARFCLKTGAVKAPPAYEAINCFPVRVHQDWVQVQNCN